jgi:23S rRNA (guanine745-N1)-methyltransferase
MISLLLCPICATSLEREGTSLKCECGHSYDFAKSGYINLLNPGKKNNAKAGDSKEMIRARTSFFESGAYLKIRDFLCDIVKGYGAKSPVIVDAGCGDGYYSNALAKNDTSSFVFGFDMSKFGTEHASKQARAHNASNTFYSVSNIFALPLKDESCDVVVSMFAPVASDEFKRILRCGGILVVGAAGVNHLDGLKSVIYEDAYLNEENNLSYNGFELISREKCDYVAEITGNDTISNLFTMTPYYHRTSLADKKKLEDITSIETNISVDFFIFKRL